MLAACLDDRRHDEAILKSLGYLALHDLKRKLPADLLEEFDSPERLRNLLDQVGPLLFQRLLGRAGPNEA